MSAVLRLFSLAGLAFLALASPASAAAPPLDAARVATLLEQRFASLHPADGPGCAVGVGQAGRVVASRADGYANLDLGVRLTTQSVFDIGSSSKQFTGAAIAILARRGKLDLNADIRSYLPGMKALSKPITVLQLLHHSGGLPDVYEPLAALTGDSDGNYFPSADALRMAEGFRDTRFAPGAKFEYSNTGYLLLGRIIEQRSGMTQRNFADSALFKPLGMAHTHIHDNAREIVRDRASAYSRKPDDSGWEWRHSDFTLGGDGTVLSTVQDMITWYGAIAGARIEGGRATIDMMTTPGVYAGEGPTYRGEPIQYGFGLQLLTIKGQKAIGHTGSWAGFVSAAYWFPDRDVSVVALCNYRNIAVMQALSELAGELAGDAAPR